MKKRTAIVTGASGDIGGAIAERLAADGYHLVLIGNKSKERLLEVADKCREYAGQSGKTIFSMTGDLGEYTAAEVLLAEAIERLQQVDLLVNCAGMAHIGLLADMSHDEWNNVLNTNLSSVFYCCRAVVPSMVRRKCGHILNISSVWGSVGASCEVAYSATKGGINAFTKALAKELAPSNIQVNAVACGAIDTEMNQWMEEEDLIGLVEDIPAGRLGRAEEVADLVYHLGYKNAYLTGQVIGLDGGWT